jgi:hypothetical protein
MRVARGGIEPPTYRFQIADASCRWVRAPQKRCDDVLVVPICTQVDECELRRELKRADSNKRAVPADDEAYGSHAFEFYTFAPVVSFSGRCRSRRMRLELRLSSRPSSGLSARKGPASERRSAPSSVLSFSG